MGMRQILDNMEPHFHKGGKYENWYALYEAVDTIFYSPGSTTKTTAHLRNAVDPRRYVFPTGLCGDFRGRRLLGSAVRDEAWP